MPVRSVPTFSISGGHPAIGRKTGRRTRRLIIAYHDRCRETRVGAVELRISQKIRTAQRAHEVNTRREIARMDPRQLAQAPVGGNNPRRASIRILLYFAEPQHRRSDGNQRDPE
jgi:hypothetical protein